MNKVHKCRFKVVVATSAIICKKGFAPHTGARAIPPTLLDTWRSRNHYFVLLCPARACDYLVWRWQRCEWLRDLDVCLTVQERHWLTLLSGVHEVFVALETERLCKFVSLVMFVPGEHYISGALQAQSSSAYSSSTDEGWIPRNTVYWAGSGAFLQVCRVEGSMDFSCVVSQSSVK